MVDPMKMIRNLSERSRAVFRATVPFVLVAGAIGLLTPAAAQAPGIPLLAGLDKGAWEIRFRDGTPSRRICVRSGREFIQLRHAGQNCGRYAVDEAPNEVTVQYSCKGDGYGRTYVRKETHALVQLESQGIAGGLPFQFTAEARHIGPC